MVGKSAEGLADCGVPVGSATWVGNAGVSVTVAVGSKVNVVVGVNVSVGGTVGVGIGVDVESRSS